MAEAIIEFTGDPSGLKPLADALKALGQLTDEQVEQFNKASQSFEQFNKKASESTKKTTKDVDALNKGIEHLSDEIMSGAMEELAVQMGRVGKETVQTAEKSKSLVAQLRALKNEIAQLEPGSAQFTKLSIEAAKLEKKISDTNKQINILASDTFALDALVEGAQGVVGAFAAAQGAVALFGDENEDLQKALLKVNGAMALLQGLQQVQRTLLEQNAAKTFIVTNAQKIYTFVTNGATVATRALNAALVATIGGAIIAGIIALIANWRSLAEAIGLAKKETEEFGDATEEVFAKNNKAVEQIKSRFDVSQKSTRDLRSEVSRLEESLEDLGRRSNIEIIVNGKTVKQDTEKAKQEILKQIQDIQAEIDRREFVKVSNLTDQVVKQKEQIESLDPIEVKAEVKTVEGVQGVNIDDTLEMEKEKRLAVEEQISDASIQIAKETFDTVFEISSQNRQRETEAALAQLDTERAALLKNKDLTENQRAAIEERFRKKEAKIKQDAFEADKKAKIAQTVIAGALAIIQGFAQLGPIGGAISAVVIAATTAAQIASISSQKAPKFAKGTKDAPGGLAWVGEEGAELMHVPKGAKIIPHPESVKVMQGHPAAMDILSDYNIPVAARNGTNGLSEGKLAKAIAREMRKTPRYQISVEGHATVKEIDRFSEKTYLDRSHSFG